MSIIDPQHTINKCAAFSASSPWVALPSLAELASLQPSSGSLLWVAPRWSSESAECSQCCGRRSRRGSSACYRMCLCTPARRRLVFAATASHMALVLPYQHRLLATLPSLPAPSLRTSLAARGTALRSPAPPSSTGCCGAPAHPQPLRTAQALIFRPQLGEVASPLLAELKPAAPYAITVCLSPFMIIWHMR